MHVYADTFAHQGFAGLLNAINDVNDPHETGDEHQLPNGIGAWLQGIIQPDIPCIGHGRALTLPDMPFLQWEYTNGKGEIITRDNATIFLQAADGLCMFMQTCKSGEAPTGINPSDRDVISHLFMNTTSPDAGTRHARWIAAIQEGRFHFGPQHLAYDKNAWRTEALGTSAKCAQYAYSPGFLTTRWKYFQDALQRHRLTVLREILPKYGICAG